MTKNSGDFEHSFEKMLLKYSEVSTKEKAIKLKEFKRFY